MTPVDGVLDGLRALISAHSALAGSAVGALAFMESLIVIGMFVPAVALLIGVGGLMATESSTRPPFCFRRF